MIALGLDIGSRTVDAVWLGDGGVVDAVVTDSGYDPAAAARALVDRRVHDTLVATGYGRHGAREAFDCTVVTEIRAYAMGVHALFPGSAGVLDIGGQDTKTIALTPDGRVAKFEMNDRCAAGTGKFLEVMAQRLGYTLDEFQRASRLGDENVTINSMCTVFAESEVVGLLNRGFAREDIGRALHRSIARRIAAMFGRACNGDENRILATGGGSLNNCLVTMLGEQVKQPIQTRELAQFAGAIGCAICGTTATAAR